MGRIQKIEIERLNQPIFDSQSRLKDRPLKPPFQSRVFPKDFDLFRAIQSQSPTPSLASSGINFGTYGSVAVHSHIIGTTLLSFALRTAVLVYSILRLGMIYMLRILLNRTLREHYASTRSASTRSTLVLKVHLSWLWEVPGFQLRTAVGFCYQ